MIDLRSLQWPPVGISSQDIEIRARQGARFIWQRVCEHCRASGLTYRDGVPYCLGCGRAAILSSLEDDLPGTDSSP